MFVPTLRLQNSSAFANQFGNLFDNFFAAQEQPTRQSLPAINLWEGENSFTVEAEVPGYLPEQLDIQLDGQILHIRCNQEQCIEEEHQRTHRRERKLSSFHKQIELPSLLSNEEVKASLEHGILSIEIAKQAKQEAQRIAIQIKS